MGRYYFIIDIYIAHINTYVLVYSLMESWFLCYTNTTYLVMIVISNFEIIVFISLAYLGFCERGSL